MEKEEIKKQELILILGNCFEDSEQYYEEIISYMEEEVDFHIETNDNIISGIHEIPEDYGNHGTGYVWSYNDRQSLLREMEEGDI